MHPTPEATCLLNIGLSNRKQIEKIPQIEEKKANFKPSISAGTLLSISSILKSFKPKKIPKKVPKIPIVLSAIVALSTKTICFGF